jgi:SAM-dependent methyltransferase
MILHRLKYYLKSTYRRQILDKLLKKYEYIYKGIVLDIGGRDRGKFTKPKHKVDKWIFADIEEKHQPDILLDISDMYMIDNESIDIVSAMEVFEHVEKINQGISECYRVLKKGGKLILSVPFLYPVHADPFDFQRWTLTKWEKELTQKGFKIEQIDIMGHFFTVKNSMNRALIQSLPFFIRYFGYLLFPFFDLINRLDKTKYIQNHSKLGNYHGGYFIIAEK